MQSPSLLEKYHLNLTRQVLEINGWYLDIFLIIDYVMRSYTSQEHRLSVFLRRMKKSCEHNKLHHNGVSRI